MPNTSSSLTKTKYQRLKQDLNEQSDGLNHFLFFYLRLIDIGLMVFLFSQLVFWVWPLAVLIADRGVPLDEVNLIREYFIVFLILKFIGYFYCVVYRQLENLLKDFYVVLFLLLPTTAWAIQIFKVRTASDDSQYYDNELQLFQATSIFDFIGCALAILHFLPWPTFYCCVDRTKINRYYNPIAYALANPSTKETQKSNSKSGRKKDPEKNTNKEVSRSSSNDDTRSPMTFADSDKSDASDDDLQNKNES